MKFGSNPTMPRVNIDITPVTIFVGPNNSGKSLVLREINEFCQNGQKHENFKIIDDIKFKTLTSDQISSEIEVHTLEPNHNERIFEGQILFGDERNRNRINEKLPHEFLSDPNGNIVPFCKFYLRYKTLKLDGLNRIFLINDQAIGDLQKVPESNLAILFQDDIKRLEVRRIIYDAFKLYFVVDPTSSGQIRIRLSKEKPENHLMERGLHKEAIDFHKKAILISQASDGVKAYTGIITSIIAGKPKITFIDEPEAFLHPSLSYKLGKEVSNASMKESNNLIVSTHSSNFLMGCIQSGSPITIVRLSYSREIASARTLNSSRVEELMRDPLLRSVGVLNALFYEYVIVTEGDSDRAFYQEINDRMLEFDNKNAIPNCLFLNANGKDTIWRIVKPLREMGIPAVGIYDIDLFKNEGNNWTNALKSAFVPELNHQPLGQTRSLIKKKFDQSGKDMKKDGGIKILSKSDAEAGLNLIKNLKEYGIFIVENGEVENWLPSLNVNAHKSEWLSKMFERMGSNPADSNYIKPSTGDIWEFMTGIQRWMMKEDKNGIPE
ncbi:ATP-binding protein [Fulvivirga sp.]|uniref:ATP-dependent nuclease n=1 Tax=Fulvivirga sp. TaxID=1931237 RepID=UPI0032EBC2B6